MNIDVEDVLAGALSSIIGRAILFVFAMWLGCTIGGMSLIVGMIVQEGTWQLGGVYQWLWASPMLLFSQWGFLNFPFLIFAFIYFIRSENAGYRAWGIILGVESLMVMLGWCKYPMQPGWPIVSAWLTWALVLAMVETGVWLLYQHQVNIWAREMGMLRSEIAQRRAEKVAKENILINREKQEGPS